MNILKILSISSVLIFLGTAQATVKGGTTYINLGQSPTTLNPLSSTDGYSKTVKNYVMDTLMQHNPDTWEWEPMLAQSAETSKDGLSFTFTIRDGVKWHDGKPLTAEDVKFSFEAIMDKDNKYGTAHLKPYFENIVKAETMGKNKIKFTANKLYFGNFGVLAELYVVPKHIYENPSEKKKKKLNKTLIGSGPYILDEYKKGKKLVLKRNMNWWGIKDPYFSKLYNFDKIYMRFISDTTIALTRLEKGDIDYLGMSAEDYMKKAVGDKWGKEVIKKQVQNSSPAGYTFIGWNLTKPIFKGKKTRKGLSHLLNRKLMNDKFSYGLTYLATGPFYIGSGYEDPSVKPIPFDPKKALEFFKEDGWKTDAQDRVLYKMIDGKKERLSFTILEPSKDYMRFLTIFKEDAKKVGVDVNLKFVEWTTFIKLIDEKNFDAVRLAWGAGDVDPDPKQIWHSESSKNGGSNFISFNNPEVDKLIDEARQTLDKKKRIPIIQKIHRIIADEAPYTFFFNRKFSFYGYREHMKMEKETYKYGVGSNFWWMEK